MSRNSPSPHSSPTHPSEPPLDFSNGRYLDLARPPSQVRSTINIVFSCDARCFASTHGDHTVKVFSYPAGSLRHVLEGHSRTAWAAAFHPTRADLLATGCLAGECRLWNVESGQCVAVRKFASSIACLAFHAGAQVLAVAVGQAVVAWRYMEAIKGANEKGVQYRTKGGVLLRRSGGIYVVQFNEDGDRMLVGMKNERGHDAAGKEDPFTLHVSLHEFCYDPDSAPRIAGRLLNLPRVAAYGPGGMHMSTCGNMLAACLPSSPEGGSSYHICVLSLEPKSGGPVGSMLYNHPVASSRLFALTTLRFSPTGRQLLAAYSMSCETTPAVARRHSYAEDMTTIGGHAIAYDIADLDPLHAPIAEIYNVGEPFEVVERLGSIPPAVGEDDEKDYVNIAAFAPKNAEKAAVLYGTTQGRVRMFIAD